jgi:hypothetical protein
MKKLIAIIFIFFINISHINAQLLTDGTTPTCKAPRMIISKLFWAILFLGLFAYFIKFVNSQKIKRLIKVALITALISISIVFLLTLLFFVGGCLK